MLSLYKGLDGLDRGAKVHTGEVEKSVESNDWSTVKNYVSVEVSNCVGKESIKVKL